ncbi:hypothetical protein EG344_19950 [Chryseobacterium sp. G0162]|uniref:hypothetical protein n=1 Tax=Chryseobacterium sp. G0162 TaxID=2487063 RepID=UPI000F4F146F|nr:hypothetical protein [Chryseobacterium sp. G0162]AZB10944.1 hypothetical protein EG344_19950 [Chryseobacterium sp. G0162]
MKTTQPELAKIFTDCIKQATEQTNTCMYPGCEENAINSHIMQKNGILSSIAEDRHLWQSAVNHFKQEYIGFQKKGINKVYTFLGFCNNHDTSVFQKIESKNKIDFSDYESSLLFALRTACNEYRIKEIVIKHQKCILAHPDTISSRRVKIFIEQNEIGLQDLTFFIDAMWNDLNNNTESFEFSFREFEWFELCLNSIYTYDTSQEIENHIRKHGVDMPRTSQIFISLFPYDNKSILLMGYHKDDTSKVKSFVNLFFKENEKRLKRRLSSLITFNCETWVCSERLYQSKFQGLDSEFFKTMLFSAQNGNERKTFDVNLFADNFKEKFKDFVKKNIA